MKRSLDDLAVFGGAPAFLEPLHVGRPNIGIRNRFLERINDLLDRRWLTNHGRYVKEFEARIAERVGVRNCIVTCNATAGLEILIRALELSGGVIIPAFTFIASAHALQWQGITPIFCDIDPQTHNLDPVSVEALITPAVTGVMGVHMWGRACDVDALTSIAHRHGLKLIFDAAHAFESTYLGRKIGGFGNAEVFSFHATKFLNSFEGGAIVTNDDQLASKIRLMKNFGFTDYDEVSCLGTNAKMNEACAAMGLTSLESVDRFIAVNRVNFECYAQELSGIRGMSLIRYNDRETSNYQYVVTEIDETVAGINRDIMQQILQAENVIARRYFYPGCHRMEPYRSHCPNVHLAHTDMLVRRVVCLPTGTTIAPPMISTICELIRLVVENASEVQARLASTLSRLGKVPR